MHWEKIKKDWFNEECTEKKRETKEASMKSKKNEEKAELSTGKAERHMK
jgi:hypothetical protein